MAAAADTPVTPRPIYEQALRQEITLICRAGALPILASPAVIGEHLAGGNPRDALLDEYTGISRKVAADMGVTFCDLRTAFRNYLQTHNPDNREKGILTSDGVYLSAAGNRLVAEWAARSILSALRAAPWFIPLRDTLLLPGQRIVLQGRGRNDRGLEIRYTLDGNPPTEHSPRYRHPIAVKATCLTILVKETATGHTYTSKAWFTPTTLREPEQPRQLARGLDYLLYDYDATATKLLPDFTRLTPVKRGTLDTPFFFPEKGQEVLALQMHAYIDIPRWHLYLLFTFIFRQSALYR